MRKKSFLEEIAEKIVVSQVSLQETAILLPNKRAKRMLLKVLAKQCKKSVFAPTIFTIDEFMDKLSPYQRLTKVELMVKLHEVHQEFSENDFTEDVFTWIPAFVDDISEMDMQLADAVSIFHDLSNAKEFEFTIGHDNLSEYQKKHLKLYQLFADIYTQFKQKLRDQGLGYAGMIYRDCADHVGDYVQKLPFKNYVFAGFHVLNPAELTVVAYIKEHYNTQIYFDIDPFYCDFKKDERYSTAHFVRKICERLKLPEEQIEFKQSHYKDTEKNIQIVGTSKTMNQIYYAIHCLKEIESRQGNLNDTAVVLADEQLLLPFLSAYGIENVNITMGYPFKETPAYTLMNVLFDLYHQALQFHSKGQELRFQHKQLIYLLRSPLVRKHLFKDAESYNTYLKQLDESQKIVFSISELQQTANEYAIDIELPKSIDEKHEILSAVTNYMQRLLDKISKERSQDSAILCILVEQLRHTQELLQPLLQSLGFSTMKYLVEQQVGQLSVPIKGDATQGLQVMGLLETRTLDFKNVIMLSVNEGTLPSGIRYNSLIPFEFKFNGEALENYLYKDQVYAYHFFRLLQRAENVVLLYNNVSEDTTLTEKSRFIMQLEFEIQEQQLDNINLSYPVVNFSFTADTTADIIIQKNDEILEALKAYKYSASSFNDYLSCPLKFYLKSICNIRPPETFKEKIGSNIIGTISHSCFEDVCKDIMANPCDYENIIQKHLDNKENLVRKKFLENKELNIKDKDLDQGRVLLAVKMVEYNVAKYLPKLKEELAKDVRILGNELELQCTLPVTVETENHEIHLTGTIDRLQVKDGNYEVIDYKTGKVDSKKLLIKNSNLDKVFTDTEYNKFIQLLFYAILCKKNTNNPVFSNTNKQADIKGIIISIPDVNKNDAYLHASKFNLSDESEPDKKKDTDLFTVEILNLFEKALAKVFAEILNPKVAIVQTTDTTQCKYCDFKHMCRR